MKKLLATAMFGAVAATTLATAPTASAGTVKTPGAYYYVTPCAGKIVAQQPLRGGWGTPRGMLRLYYSPNLGGTTCAMLLDQAAGKHRMKLRFARFGLKTYATDVGTYSSYAGGLAAPRSKGHCAEAVGEINYGGTNYQGYVRRCF